MKQKFLKNIEWVILIMPLILFVIGLVAIYSSTKNVELEEFYKQITWSIISIPFLILFMFLNYEKISRFHFLYYILTLISLVLVLFMPALSGARSWFNFGNFLFQPSEFAKIFILIFFAKYISNMQVRNKEDINKFWNLIKIGILMLLPVSLIILQPDYGTAFVYVFMFLAILFVSGVKKRYFLIAIILGILILIPIFKYILPVRAPHALKRFEVFLDPTKDPRGSGYNLIQSKLAVGSGGVFGMGFTKGTQTQLGYLYPKTTDFIFAVIAEEFGFILASIVIIFYSILIVKIFWVGKTSKDNLGEYISVGVGGMLLFHMLQNIGMTMGLLPITGVPLPFVSYGGSSLISNFIAIGIVLNISANRKKAIFVEIE